MAKTASNWACRCKVALPDASSGMLRDAIQQLFCSRQITGLSTPFSSRRVSGSSTWTERLNSCLKGIQLDAQPPQTQQQFICSFPRFFFLSLGRHAWTNDHMVKDCSRVTFPVMPDMVPYAFLTKNCSRYQSAVCISHPAIPRTMRVIISRSSEYSVGGFD
jgi:hypothetical protein